MCESEVLEYAAWKSCVLRCCQKELTTTTTTTTTTFYSPLDCVQDYAGELVPER